MDSSLTSYLVRLKDRIYYLLVLREREENGFDAHFSQCAVGLSERMNGALERFPELAAYDAYTDAIDAIAFCAGKDVSLQHIRTHILNTINDIDRLIAKLEA